MKKNIILLASAMLVLTACSGNGNSTPEGSAASSKATGNGIALKKNNEGEEVSILHPEIQRYCDDMYAAAEEQGITGDELYKIRPTDKTKDGYLCPGVFATAYQGKDDGNDRDNFEPIELEWEAEGYEGEYVLKYSTSEDLADAKTKTVTEAKTTLINLLCDTTYYWRVESADGAKYSETGSFHTKGSFRDITCGPAYNVRDFGGKMTESGRKVKQGLVYRGGELTKTAFDGTIPNIQKHIVTCDDETIAVLHDELNIRTEVDLRTSGRETNNQSKSDLGDDVAFVQDPTGSGYATMWNQSNASTLAIYKDVFKKLGAATPDNAVYFHCWGGADRTGTIAFLLDGLLGVSYLEACMDYEFTSFDTIHTRIRQEAWRDNSGTYDFTGLTNGMMSSTYYAEDKTFSEVVEGWMKAKVGLTDEEISSIRENLLEPVAE